MYDSQISDEKLMTMAAEATRCMDPELYEKGMSFFKRDRVKWAKVFGPRIYASVSDGKMHTVTINIDNFSQSTCTCEKKHLCEHIAAVFFDCYASCSPWLNLNEVLALNLKANPKSDTKKPPAREKKQTFSLPDVEDPVELWYAYFEREYDLLRISNKRFSRAYFDYHPGELYSSASLFGDFISKVSAHSNNWPSFKKTLYQLHSSLFFMDRLEKQVKDATPSYMDSYLIDQIEDDFMQALTSTISIKKQEEYRPFYEKAVEVVRERLFDGKTPFFDWLSIYRLMCVTFFDDDDWREKETAYLEKAMKGFEQNQRNHYYASLGLASLKMADGSTDAALTVLRKLKKKRISDMLFYLEYLAGAKEWEKLKVWLRWLAPGVKEANPAIFEDICDYCILTAKNSSAGEEMINLIRSWLPRSIDFYAAYLIESELFREWAELIMSCREYTWENINKSVLRHLESRAPAALTPLYHQWAARLIEEKNRKSYQQAVKLLKKLHTLYNKQKLTSEWNTFISRLASYYPRMRAFQEELRKGKLIS